MIKSQSFFKKEGKILENYQEYLKITIKQHYIPKVYLKNFRIKNNDNSDNKKVKVFLHEKNGMVNIEATDNIFFKNLEYTKLLNYLKVLENLKGILKKEIENYSKNKIVFEEKIDNEIKNFIEIFNHERKPLLNKHFEITNENYKHFHESKKEQIVNSLIFKDTQVLMKSLNYKDIFKISSKKFFEKTLKEIEKFLKKNNYKIKNDDIKKAKELSNSFYNLLELLENKAIIAEKAIEIAKQEVIERSKNDLEVSSDFQKKYAVMYNDIIENHLKEINCNTIKNIIIKLNREKKRDKLFLENLLGKFEDGCIVNKKNINKLDNILKKKVLKKADKEFLKNSKLNIMKFLLVQYYRMLYINEKNTELQREIQYLLVILILKCNSYKNLKKFFNCNLLNFNGIIVRVDEDKFCTSDNPILYDKSKKILMYTLTPQIIYFGIEDSDILLTIDILNLSYKNEKSLIDTINYFIISNAQKKIISNTNIISIKKETMENFLKEFKEILKKYNKINCLSNKVQKSLC